MAFWKPGTKGPGIGTNEWDRENPNAEDGPVLVYNPNAKLSVVEQRQRLPTFSYRTQILYLVEKYQTVVIVGHTGCGKTTQIPQYLHEAGWTSGPRMVACTQPRRVAATSVASRVAEEMNVPLGQEVGYTIRFDDKSDPHRTKIKYMTDGMMLRETLMDPLLSRYSVIMVDEAHERSLYTDILIGLLKKIQKRRPDLRLIISSATIDAELFKNFFNTNTSGDPSKDTATILSVEGRQHPVDILFSMEPVDDYVQEAIRVVNEIHSNEPDGDILVFMTGQEEIDRVTQALMEQAAGSSHRMRVYPLYSQLPYERQMRIFDKMPRGVRKVIVSTNIAETSVTIDGIIYVVDCCFVKMRAYNPKSGMESLVVNPVSKAAANQRAGRAGRTMAGKCYRLCTEKDFKSLLDSTTPEMQRSNLTPVVLQLKALGIDDILHFEFLSPPPVESMIRALELLYALGAIDDRGHLTDPLGNQMAEFPVDPPLAKMILSSPEFGCSQEIITIASMLNVQNVFVFASDNKRAAEAARKSFAVAEGDHISLLNVYNCFIKNQMSTAWCQRNFLNHRSLNRAAEIHKQLTRYMKKHEKPIVSAQGDHEKIRRCIVSGFFANAAKLAPDGSYRTIKDNYPVNIHPNSVLFRGTSVILIKQTRITCCFVTKMNSDRLGN
eukprot:TRINITY_DN413_c0_g1_i3.p1 TRINITY_DN413_c0_g1~~TRINITY_DN413_c0_g1_i3.p1  ORF type:complete len:663 (-),score=132.26 TRINITY_DN413_c0_g1_i3:375-2363(-)